MILKKDDRLLRLSYLHDEIMRRISIYDSAAEEAIQLKDDSESGDCYIAKIGALESFLEWLKHEDCSKSNP